MMYEYFILGILIFVAVFYDIRYSRIPNLLLIFGFISGLFVRFSSPPSISNLLPFILGLGFPLCSLYLLFKIRVLGAGDIKLLAVIGFYTGIDRIIPITVYSMFIAGFYGLILLFIVKDYRRRILSLIRYASHSIKEGRIISYSNFTSDKNKQIYFSIAIGLAYFLEIILKCFN